MKFRSKQWTDWHSGSQPNDKNIVNNESIKQQFDLFISNIDLNKNKSYNIIEIGPFRGALCNLLLTKYNNINSYTLVDDKTLLDSCKETFKNNSIVEYCIIDDIQTLNINKFDILISNNCLSETTHEYQNYIFSNFFKKVDIVFIIDNFLSSHQFNMDADVYFENISKALDENFIELSNTNLDIIPPGHKKKLLIGKNNKNA